MARMKYLVLHCTATPEGREVTSKEIRHWHTDPVSKGGAWLEAGRLYRPDTLGRQGGTSCR